MMQRKWPLLALAGAAALLTACASADYHYSQLVGRRYYRVPIDTYNVSIVRVDGETNILRPALIDPGRRLIEVQGPPGGAGGIGEVRSVTLDIAPCTRYYLVAHKVNTLASDFDVRVDFQEPVPGCTPPRAS